MAQGFKNFLWITGFVVFIVSVIALDRHIKQVRSADCNDHSGTFTRIGKGAVCMQDGKIIKVYW